MAENYVTIELSRKQVDATNPKYNEKTGKNYVRIYAPGGGVIFYPSESIKVKKDDPERVYFVRPAGTELQINYSEKIDGVPDDAPNERKYKNYSKTVKIEDLKTMYDKEKKSYAETHGFYNMSVPTEWGKGFESSGQRYVSISIPIPVDERDVYYSFILPEERFKKSEKEEGMSYFGFPKKKKDNPEEDYMIQMKTRERISDNPAEGYQDKYMNISSSDLKKYIDTAKQRNHIKDFFVSTTISSKLAREFENKEGRKLVGISVPVYEANDNLAYYEIVVPTERVRKNDKNPNMVSLNLFKNGPDGKAYVFTGKKSFLNPETNQYDTVQLKMTSKEVVNNFELSAARYRELHSNNAERTLADEIDYYNRNDESKTEVAIPPNKEPITICAYEYEHNDGDQIWSDTTTFYQVNESIKRVYEEGYYGSKKESFVTKNEMIAEMEDIKSEVGLNQRGGYNILKDIENFQENTIPFRHSHRR